MSPGVYARLEELIQLNALSRQLRPVSSRVIRQPQSGAHHSRFKGRGMEFAEVRAYQAGDDVRSIDWRVTARRQTPHTKLFQEERERPVMILCDQSSSMFFGSQHCMKSVLAARGAALLAWSALAHNDRVGGIVFSDSEAWTVKPARSRKALLRYFNYVEQANRELNANSVNQLRLELSPLNTALLEASQVVKPGTLVMLLTDFHGINQQSVKHLTSLARHNEVVLLRCADPLEKTIPLGGALPMRSGDDVVFLSSSDKQTRKALETWDASIREQLASIERAKNVHYWDLSTHLPIEQQLREVTNQIQGQGQGSGRR